MRGLGPNGLPHRCRGARKEVAVSAIDGCDGWGPSDRPSVKNACSPGSQGDRAQRRRAVHEGDHPVGVPPPGTQAIATAVNATSWPTAAGLAEEAMETTVPSFSTVTLTAGGCTLSNKESPL